MAAISHGADWDFDLLERYDTEIAKVAGEFGLDGSARGEDLPRLVGVGPGDEGAAVARQGDDAGMGERLHEGAGI